MANFGLLRFLIAAAFTLAAGVGSSEASVAVLVGEPYGAMGTVLPVGHTGIYLDRLCADGPVKVRMCEPGEPEGVVIERLNKVEVDWMATPVLEFLYGVDKPEEVLRYATQAEVAELRENYRRRYLAALLPGDKVPKADHDWRESVAMSYNQRMWGYQLATTREQDERLAALLNAEENRHQYHLRKTNCADFAARVVNFYYPGTVKVNGIADFWMMTPKQVARSVGEYGHTHPEAELRVLEIPQMAGSESRSHPVRGASELFLKTKRYLVTLTAIQPELVVALAVVYIGRGRWDIRNGGLGGEFEVAEPSEFARRESETVASVEGWDDP